MLVVVGEALMDMVSVRCDGADAHRARPGGSPFNVAIGCARLAVPTAFLGRLSTDAFGQRLVRRLADDGVDTRYLVAVDDLTALAFVHTDAAGIARYSFYMEGTAERGLTTADIPEDLAASSLHVGSIALVLEPIASTVEHLVERLAPQVTVSIDPNVRAQFISDREGYRRRLLNLVARAHLVKVSDEDLAWLEPGSDPVDVAHEWVGRGPALVVVTRGSHGAVAVTNDAVVSEQGQRVEVVDTVGAGDSFMSALLAWLADHHFLEVLRERPPQAHHLAEMIRFAARAAAITCSRMGADPPVAAELR